MFTRNRLTGARIASFRLPWARWKIALIALYVVIAIRFVLWFSNYRYAFPVPLALLAGISAELARPRYIQIYEKGLSIPKAAGEVFLSREQVLDVRLEGNRLIVTGPDAAWGGPYSGGIFGIRSQDLCALEDVLTRF